MMDSKERIRFIVNPISGKSRKSQLPQQIQQTIDTSKYDFDISFSEFPGHGKLLAQDAVDKGYQKVVAVGGDGTINEIGSVLIGTDVALGIIPFGSGNGLSHHLHIPLSPVKAIQLINKGHLSKIDTVSVNNTPFISIGGVGLDAKIAYQFSTKKGRGFDTYFRFILQDFVNYKEEFYTIITDSERIKTKALFISFANSNEQGFNIPISPKANLIDGMVDICIIKKPNFFELPFTTGILLSRNMDQSINAHIIKTKRAKIIREKDGLVNIDGEAIEMNKDLEIIVNPLSLNIITHEKQKF